MDIFWSELKHFYKRRVKAWSLFYGIPLTAYIANALFGSLRTSIGFIHSSGHLYDSPLNFYSTNGLFLLLLLLCGSLTASKLIAAFWPAEINTGTDMPKQTGPNDPTVWPPRPKPPI